MYSDEMSKSVRLRLSRFWEGKNRAKYLMNGVTSNAYTAMVDSGGLDLITFIRPCIKLTDRVTLCFACINIELDIMFSENGAGMNLSCVYVSVCDSKKSSSYLFSDSGDE